MMLQDLLFFATAIFIILFAASVLVHIFFLVPFVPTSKRVVAKMIDAAQLRPRDTVMDIGCGDGRLLFAAEKKQGVKAMGFEIAPLVYLLAIFQKIIRRSKAKIRFKNFLKANLRQANVIFCYLIPSVMPDLAFKIKRECKKGTKVISNTFHIPGLEPMRVIPKDPLKKTPTIYVYRI